MFKIEMFVEDENLATVMHVLSDVAIDLRVTAVPRTRLEAGSKPKPKAKPKTKLRSKANGVMPYPTEVEGTDPGEMLANYMRQHNFTKLDPTQVRVTLPLVFAYTALHFFAFIMFGIATAVLLLAADYEPVFALAAIFLLAIFEIFFVGALAVFDQAALTALGFWKILGGNVLAMAAMLGYFETRHRGWWSRFRERWEVLQLRRN